MFRAPLKTLDLPHLEARKWAVRDTLQVLQLRCRALTHGHLRAMAHMGKSPQTCRFAFVALLGFLIAGARAEEAAKFEWDADTAGLAGRTLAIQSVIGSAAPAASPVVGGGAAVVAVMVLPQSAEYGAMALTGSQGASIQLQRERAWAAASRRSIPSIGRIRFGVPGSRSDSLSVLRQGRDLAYTQSQAMYRLQQQRVRSETLRSRVMDRIQQQAWRSSVLLPRVNRSHQRRMQATLVRADALSRGRHVQSQVGMLRLQMMDRMRQQQWKSEMTRLRAMDNLQRQQWRADATRSRTLSRMQQQQFRASLMRSQVTARIQQQQMQASSMRLRMMDRIQQQQMQTAATRSRMMDRIQQQQMRAAMTRSQMMDRIHSQQARLGMGRHGLHMGWQDHAIRRQFVSQRRLAESAWLRRDMGARMAALGQMGRHGGRLSVHVLTAAAHSGLLGSGLAAQAFKLTSSINTHLNMARGRWGAGEIATFGKDASGITRAVAGHFPQERIRYFQRDTYIQLERFDPGRRSLTMTRLHMRELALSRTPTAASAVRQRASMGHRGFGAASTGWSVIDSLSKAGNSFTDLRNSYMQFRNPMISSRPVPRITGSFGTISPYAHGYRATTGTYWTTYHRPSPGFSGYTTNLRMHQRFVSQPGRYGAWARP